MLDHVMNGRHVRMVDAGSGARLLNDPVTPFFALQPGRDQALERDFAMEPRIAAEEDLSHAAAAEPIQTMT